MGSFWGSKRNPNRFHRLSRSDPGRSGFRFGCFRPFQKGKANDGQPSDRSKRASGGGLGPSGGGSWAAFGNSWVLNVNDRWPSAPLLRLRADTAERGTSRERHRWADVCGKCRVSQCGGRGGRRWEPSCASMAVVVTAVKVTCIRYRTIVALNGRVRLEKFAAGS